MMEPDKSTIAKETTRPQAPITGRMAAVVLKILQLPLIVLMKLAKACYRLFFFAVRYLGYFHHRLSFAGREDDIYIVSYPKSGTTWVQMILYQLTSDGNMDFEHITEVSPWQEVDFFYGERRMDRMPSPRLIKSHYSYARCLKRPGKYIYVVRDGRDVLVSNYYQAKNLFRYQGDFAKVFQRFMAGRMFYGSWFKHVHDWCLNAKGLDLLIVNFEALKNDPTATIKKIAAFCELVLSEEKLKRVEARTGFSFMRAHEARFRPQPRDMDGSILKGPPPAGHFIRKGESGDGRSLFDETMLRAYEAAYDRWIVTPGLDLGEVPTPTHPA